VIRDGPAIIVIIASNPKTKLKGIQLQEGPKTQKAPQIRKIGINKQPGIFRPLSMINIYMYVGSNLDL